MSIDTGKDAKRGGKTRPRDARKVDQEPPKPTKAAYLYLRPRRHLVVCEYLPWYWRKDAKTEWVRMVLGRYERKSQRDQALALWRRRAQLQPWCHMYRNIKAEDE